MRQLQLYLAAGGLLAALFTVEPASAQKPGGILRMPIGNSPASMSIHEEATRIAVTPMCGAERNYTAYCNPEFDKLVDRQSIEADTAKRRELVWQIERILAEEMVRPVIFYTRAATCWLPQVKDLTIMANSLFNGWRFEDLWLDK
jgi:ABC-type transport system substrate-binding protein